MAAYAAPGTMQSLAPARAAPNSISQTLEALGQQVRYLRRQARMSRNELCDASGITRAQLQSIEEGRSVHLEALMTAALALGGGGWVNQILGRKPQAPPPVHGIEAARLVGTRLAQLRHDRGISPQRAADLAGVRLNDIQKLEAHGAGGLLTLAKLVGALADDGWFRRLAPDGLVTAETTRERATKRQLRDSLETEGRPSALRQVKRAERAAAAASVATQLRALRLAANRGQAALALRAGCCRVALATLEREGAGNLNTFLRVVIGLGRNTWLAELGRAADASVPTSLPEAASFLGSQIKSARLAMNVPRAQLAEAAGVSTSCVVHLEHGKGLLSGFLAVIVALGQRRWLEALCTGTAGAALSPRTGYEGQRQRATKHRHRQSEEAAA